MLAALAGIAITFISMGFVFQIFAMPTVALVPMFIILAGYGSGARLPMGIPSGLLAVGLGITTAWGLRLFGVPLFTPDTTPYQFQFNLPQSTLKPMLAFLFDGQGWKYLSVIVPMGLFNIIGSLQNLESAEAAGDRYPTWSCLLANGIGGLAAACFGSPFPTTIYIGHPGWKAMGARWGYSVLNGVVISALCLIGGVTLVLKVVPLEATLGILLWIGVIITAQAFQEVPKRHSLAVAFGLVPALAAWGLLLVESALRTAGVSLMDAAPKFGTGLYIQGLFSLNQGFILSSMGLAAVMVHAIEHPFK